MELPSQATRIRMGVPTNDSSYAFDRKAVERAAQAVFGEPCQEEKTEGARFWERGPEEYEFWKSKLQEGPTHLTLRWVCLCNNVASFDIEPDNKLDANYAPMFDD